MRADTSTGPAAQLLRDARDALNGKHGLPASQATRAAALLARCALETFVGDELERLSVEARLGGGTTASRNFTAKLVCYRILSGEARGRPVAWTWARLSEATHHHAYELSPTHAEVEHLVTQVEVLLSR